MLSLAELPSLRQAMREKRSKLDPVTLQQHSQYAAAHFSAHFGAQLAKNSSLKVSLYSACAGELDPSELQNVQALSGATFLLPMLYGQSLRFGKINSAPMRKNRFGINEPNTPADSQLAANELDIIIVPLLAVDSTGNRLGMGGGFYDRALQDTSPAEKPLLIGYAHDFQRVATLPSQTWDIPLHGIVTERLAQRF